MTTCNRCGMTTQSEAYHQCVTMSEERVKEIARACAAERVDNHTSMVWHHDHAEIAKIAREVADERIAAAKKGPGWHKVYDGDIAEKARNAALEQAARSMDEQSGIEAARIRSLKSRPPVESDTWLDKPYVQDYHKRPHGIELPPPAAPIGVTPAMTIGAQACEIATLRARLAASEKDRKDLIAGREMADREYADLCKDRDALKAELAEAKARHGDTVACCHKFNARLRVAEEALDDVYLWIEGMRTDIRLGHIATVEEADKRCEVIVGARKALGGMEKGGGA